MQKLLYWVGLAIICLTGCVQKIPMDEATQNRLAAVIVDTSFCNQQNYVNKNIYSRHAALTMMGVNAKYTYNKAEIDAHLKDYYEKYIKPLSIEEQKERCNKVEEGMITQLSEYDQQQQLALENQRLQQQGLQDMANALNTGSATPNYYPTFSSPQLQPMGIRSNTSTHGLINTSSGLKNCTSTPSGYTYCN